MDSETRSKYASLSKEDWAKLGYQDEPGLTRTVHPLFQRTNAARPPGAEHIWPQHKSEAEYDKFFSEMGNIFKMASNILESSKSLEFLYQVAYSLRRVSQKGTNNQGRPCTEFGWTEPPTKAFGRQMAKDALRRLSHSLTFLIGHPEANPAVGDSIAVTEPRAVNFMAGVKINDASGTSGMASRITLNQVHILKLRGLGAQEGVGTTAQSMSLQFKIAITLCHEIAHALANAVDPEQFETLKRRAEANLQASREGRVPEFLNGGTDEAFYRNETMAEIGNSWENQVFGGKVSWSGETSDPLFISKWPSFFTSGDNYPTRGKGKRIARKYVVSNHFIRNLRRQAFWDNVMPGDSTALYIKKTIGIQYSNPDTEVLSVDSTEINWPNDEDSSRVSRERDGHPIPDPSSARANETEDERKARELASEPRI